ncbi:MAG: hypothetical protein EBV34_21650, partial [Betaproteobacteria bacterium]|nr:hypothetical protein [Betaproteobacteria bacterium]
QVPLTNRSLIGGTPFPVRYDLSQAFTGAIGLDRVVKQVGDKLWYCVATKLRRAREDKKARLPTLAQRLNRTGIDIDVVIVASTDPHRGTNQLFADDLEHILISGTDEASLQRSLAIVSELAVLFGGESIPVLTVGGGSAEVGIDSFNLLHEQSKALMDQPLEHQGWVRATQFATTAGEGTDTVLPSSLFRLMAGRIFPEGIGNSQRELNVIPNP